MCVRHDLWRVFVVLAVPAQQSGSGLEWQTGLGLASGPIYVVDCECVLYMDVLHDIESERQQDSIPRCIGRRLERNRPLQPFWIHRRVCRLGPANVESGSSLLNQTTLQTSAAGRRQPL